MKNLLLILLNLTVLSACSQKTELFNGKNLDSWYVDVPAMDSTNAKNPFFVRDGKLVTLGIPGGHLITKKVFSDYRVTFKYRFVAKPGNCGALVHVSKMRRLYEMFPQSVEVQLMHENAGDFWCIGENIEVPNMEERRGPKENWGVDGKKNRRIPNLVDGVEKPLGEWNHMQIECLGNEIKVWLNGTLINYGFNATASSGQFALQSEGSEVEFEDIVLGKIKVLTE
jgi:hypothetical protein